MGLRVLAVAQAAEPGGAELALLRLAPALRRQGIELELVVPAEGGVAEAARAGGLTVHRVPFGSLRRGAWPRAVLAWPRTRALVRRARPEVVWLNGVVPQRLLPALGGVPAVMYLHDLVTHSRAWRSDGFWSRVPLVACASDAVARAAGSAGAPKERLRTVFAPVESVPAAPRPAWADARPVVGFVGRLEPRKGVLDLLEAMDELPDARLVIVRGPRLEDDREYEEAALSEAARLGERAVVTGPVDDARGLMHWFDVLCVPSHVEPFGTVAAEALAAGTPAVVTDSGGMPEYVVPGETGEVVPPSNPSALAAALARTLPRSDQMAAAARAAVAPFATERVAGSLAALLHEAAQR
jgi:glycosyltransferase involved in cell wall biosynthesis